MKFYLPFALLSGLVAAAPSNPPKCPVNGTLPANYVKPSWIIKVSKKNPNTAYGATQNPKVTPNDFAAVINLDIPPSAYNKPCRLLFLFSDHKQTPNSFSFSGPDHSNFTGYAVGAKADPKKTTYKNQPPPEPSPETPPAAIRPGNAYIIQEEPCGLPPGLTQPVTVGGLLSSSDTSLNFLQSDKSCPLGFFVDLI